MVYFIRFIKVPEVVPSKSHIAVAAVKCLFDIRNDLAEALYTESVAVYVTLFDARSKARIATTNTVWDSREWSAEARIHVPKSFEYTEVILRLSVPEPNRPAIQAAEPLLLIASIQSSPLSIQIGQKADSYAQRLLFAPSGRPMPTPWEKVGSTIFGHVWDAGAVFAAHLTELSAKRARSDDSILRSPLSELLLTADDGVQTLEVLELGSGVGVVSLSVAQNFSNCHITATDTEDALPLLARNVQETRSSLEMQSVMRDPLVLHWDRPEDHDWLDETNWSLILISDCTYNSDSARSLVETISQTVRTEATLVAVALKRRHEDEAIFYELMKKAGFIIVHHYKFLIPDQSRIDEGLANEEIELYQYRLG